MSLNNTSQNPRELALKVRDNSGGGSGSGERYSEDEQIIGLWLDGSVLYRKTITTDITSSAHPDAYFATKESLGLDENINVKNIYGYIESSTYENVPINSFFSDNYKILVASLKDGTIQFSNNGFLGQTTLTLEYTR